MNKTHFLTIRLTPQEAAALKRQAAKEARSLSAQARYYIVQSLPKKDAK